MGDIRIKVGVALDANVRSVYQPLVLAAQQASQNIMRALNTGAKLTVQQQAKTFQEVTPAIAGAYKKAGKAADDSLKQVTKTAKQQADEMARDVKRAADARVREERAAMREVERDLKTHHDRVYREQTRQNEKLIKAAKEAEYMQWLTKDRYARRFGHNVLHNGTSALNHATRFASDVAHGAGVNASVGGMVHDYVRRQEMATALSTEGWIGAWGHPDTIVNGSNVKMDPKAIMSKANDIAEKTGVQGGATTIMEGMQQFLMKTGNLREAVDMMEELAVFSKATSTSMDDTLEAVGSLSNALPKTMSESDKMASIKATMRVLGGQGEIGALHVRQLARGGNMSKLAGVANQFTLDDSTSRTLEGVGLKDKASKNIAVLGAMAQMAMRKGGRESSTGTLAANSAKAFIDDLQSKTTAKRWAEAFGADAVYADKGHTQLRDPKALMLAALNKTHGAGDKIAALMPNKVSKAFVTAASAYYREGVDAYKAKSPGASAEELNKAGLDALNKSFDEFLHVTIDGTQLMDKFNEQMKTDASKVAQFNVRLQKLADASAEKLLPALEKLAPSAEKAARMFSTLLVEATEHPGKAIAIALAASITKASIQTAIQSSFENMIHGPDKLGKVGGALGQLGGVLAIASIAVTTATIGTMILDQQFDKSAKADSDRAVSTMTEGAAAATALARGTISPKDVEKVKSDLESAKARKSLIESGGQYTELDKIANDLLTIASYVSSDAAQSKREVDEIHQREYVRQLEGVNKNIEAMTKILDGIKSGTMKVEVTKAAPADDSGTHPTASKIGGH